MAAPIIANPLVECIFLIRQQVNFSKKFNYKGRFKFWKWLEHFLTNSLHQRISFDHTQLLFNAYEGPNKEAVNTIILILKQYVYAARCGKHLRSSNENYVFKK